MKKLFFICFLVISKSLFGQGNGNNSNNFTVNVIGSWMQSIPASDIIEAGNDYNLDYFSNDFDQTKVTISSNWQNKNFNVYISKNDGVWDPILDLQIRQVGIGQNFVTIPDTIGSLYFSIIGSKENIMTLEYRIKGISVLLPVQPYTTTIVYTVWQEN